VIVGVFIVKIEEIPIGTHGSRHRVKAVFPTVAGLDAKAPVRIAGVRVGIVEAIGLQGDHALVTLALDPGVVLHEGARAEVSSLGMLGDKYVELEPGSLQGPPLPPGTVLTGSSPIGFDQVLKTANEIGGDVKAVTESLRKSLGGPEGEKRLDEIVENIRKLTEDVRTLVAANRQNVDATIANFRDFSQSLKEDLPRLADRLDKLADNVDALVSENRGNIDTSIANVKDLTARLRVSADNINAITSKIATGQGTIGELVNNDETAKNLNTTLKSVSGAANSLTNTIGRAQRWRLDVNMRTEALPGLSNVNKNGRSAFGIDLHTTNKRFYRLELVDSPFGRDSVVTQVVTRTYADGHVESYTETRDHTSDSSTVNAQVGYQEGKLTLRAGLFESKGGVAVDRSFLGDRFRLSLEAYDFNRDIKPPHVRFEGRYFITKNLFAYGGWDDPVWSKHSSVLFGGGITWTDEDLKYLLGTAASFGSGH
jgi:phospholipid/cholesterol/gamma-HCH transport system substrate-binding protein